MPRKARIDAPGTLHHLICRGIERRYWLKAQGYDIECVVEKVSEVFDIDPEEIWKPGNQRLRVKARSQVCYWAV